MAVTEDATIGDSGRTLAQLSAYFDAGRTPRIAAIEDDAEARAVLDSMGTLSELTRTLAAEDSPTTEPAWIESLLQIVSREVRAGRALPVHELDARTETTMSEGALRERVRRAGDAVDGVLVGRVGVRLGDDGLRVAVAVGVRYGANLLERAAAVREAVAEALELHAPAPILAVDVSVVSVLEDGE